LAAISSAPRSRVAPGKTTRRRSWVVRTLLILALIACDSLALNGAFVGVYLWAARADAEFAASLATVGSTTWLITAADHECLDGCRFCGKQPVLVASRRIAGG
jgi:hypothetical protein